MKSKIQLHLCLLMILMSGLLGCQHEQSPFAATSKAEFRTIAWNYLSDEDKATIVHNWQQADVLLQDYGGQDLIWVIFNTKDDSLLGPIVVLIHPVSKKVIGIIPRL